MNTFQKLFYLFVLSMFPLFAYSQSCNYTLVLQDSWGDGWDAGSIDVDVAGTVTNYTFPGTAGVPAGGELQIPIAVNNGDAISLSVATASTYPSEQYYELRDATGVVVFSAGSVPCVACSSDDGANPLVVGLAWSGSATCPPCVQPAASATVVPDCANNQFTIDVALTSLGDASAINITPDVGAAQNATAAGTFTFGPYPSGTVVNFDLIHNVNNLCDLTLAPVAFSCPPPNDDCVNAISLTDGVPLASTNVAGTVGPGDDNGTVGILAACNPPAGFSIENAVWYEFTTSVAGIYTFELANVACALSASVYPVADIDCSDITNSVLTNGDCAAFGGGGGTQAWTLAASTSYYVIIDGAGGQSCTYDVSMTYTPVVTACVAGPLQNGNSSLAICPGGSGTVATMGMDTIPNTPTVGGFGWFFDNTTSGGTGALGGPFTLTGSATPYTFDADLNGLLSANSFPPFAGTWVVYSVVYADGADAVNTICSISPDSITVNFLAAAPAAGTMAGGAQVCEGSTMLNASVATAATVPTGTSQFYVLTQGAGLTIVDAGASPMFDLASYNFATLGVPDCGQFTVHSLVIDSGFDLSVITPGVTTGVDVANLISAGAVCADLDVAGTVFNVACAGDLSATTSSTAENCGGMDGTATVTPSSVNGVMSYAWSTTPAQTTATATGLTAGSYTVVVTDMVGCSVTETVVVASAGGPSGSIASVTDVDCNGASNGAIDATVTGGMMPYTFSWTDAAGTVVSTMEDPMGLPGGTYDGLITDANGCSFNATGVVVAEPTAITPALDALNNVSCNGANDGSVSVTITGGTAPYTFNWTDAGGATVSTMEDPTGLAPGTYTGNVTDANGCTLSVPGIPITEPAAITPALDALTNVSCNGGSDGSVSVTITGGTAPYTYNWTDAGGATVSTMEDPTGLAAGTYTGNVTDANGCLLSVPGIVITEPAALSATTATITDETNPGNNGAIDVTVSGGTMPYTFAWDNGGTTEDISGLTAGSYNLVVTDANGCNQSFGPYTVMDLTPVNTVQSLSILDISPNPTAGLFNINIELTQAEDIRIDIINTSGQIVETVANQNASALTTAVDLSGNAAGVYMIRFTVGAEQMARPIVLTK